MAQLTEFRQAIAAELKAGGVEAAEYVGETITPPCAVVVPADPYLEYQDPTRQTPFDHHALVLDVLVVSHRDAAKTEAEAMDALLEKSLAALDDRDVRSVSRPGVITLSGAKYLASVIRVEDQIRL